MEFLSLYKYFVMDKTNSFEEYYKTRFNAESSYHFPLKIGEYDAFFYYHPAIAEQLNTIYKLDKQVSASFKDLPGIAQNQYIKKSLIDEIEMTNQIEGVVSTRKEIHDLITDIETKVTKKNRFDGIVKKYYYLFDGKNEKFTSSADIRKLYDDILHKEVIEENPKHELDGAIFRKDQVEVDKSGISIHNGVYPESKIIEYIENSLSILNHGDLDPILRAVIFHYLFGYTHPFYDGNGRMARILTSYVISQELTPINGYRLSMSIKENLSKYYDAFKYTNDPRNRGDISTFVYEFLNILIESLQKTIIYSNNKKQQMDELWKIALSKNKLTPKEVKSNIAYYLLQAQMFSHLGITVSEIYKAGNNGTEKTIRNSLNNLVERKIAIVQRSGRTKYYMLSCDMLEEDVVKS